MEEKMKPLVTVVIPVYNHERFVAESIQSVIDQDYGNIELLIINDGSKDNSHEVIIGFEEKCKSRFKRFEYRNRGNKGLSATLNEMVEWAKGKYFSAIASDDILAVDKISLLTEKLENLDESYAVAFGDAIFIDDNSNEVYINYITGEYVTKEKGSKSFLDYFTRKRDFNYKDEKDFGSFKTLLEGNYLPAMSAVIKLEQIKEVDAWTSGNTIEDWEMWLKLSKKYKFAYVDKSVALYRWHENNSSKLLGKKLYYDAMKLLKENKEYALKNGYRDRYYKILVTQVIGLRHYDYRDFFINLITNFKDISFINFLLKKITHFLILK